MSYKSPADWTVHYANGYAQDVDVTADSLYGYHQRCAECSMRNLPNA